MYCLRWRDWQCSSLPPPISNTPFWTTWVKLKEHEKLRATKQKMDGATEITSKLLKDNRGQFYHQKRLTNSKEVSWIGFGLPILGRQFMDSLFWNLFAHLVELPIRKVTYHTQPKNNLLAISKLSTFPGFDDLPDLSERRSQIDVRCRHWILQNHSAVDFRIRGMNTEPR